MLHSFIHSITELTKLNFFCSFRPPIISPPIRQNSGSHTPRVRPHATTLNIPGMTRSKVSPDGRIAERDVAAKLVIIMVGLPARGKSYITKKIQRYLNWQQHDTRIFNVGTRRRSAAGRASAVNSPAQSQSQSPQKAKKEKEMDGATQVAIIMLRGPQPQPPPIVVGAEEPTKLDLNNTATSASSSSASASASASNQAGGSMEQSASFFDPKNETASKFREQLALETLDELLAYLIRDGGAVGILDATNSTIHRRQVLVSRVKEMEPKLGILFIESICHDENVSVLTVSLLLLFYPMLLSLPYAFFSVLCFLSSYASSSALCFLLCPMLLPCPMLLFFFL